MNQFKMAGVEAVERNRFTPPDRFSRTDLIFLCVEQTYKVWVFIGLIWRAISQEYQEQLDSRTILFVFKMKIVL